VIEHFKRMKHSQKTIFGAAWMAAAMAGALMLCAAACAGVTIQVNPSNAASVIVPANAGSTFSFAPGTYTFTTNPTGPAADWSAVPGTFVGNGAVMQLSGGAATTDKPELIKFAPGSVVGGFVFTCAQIHCEGGRFDVDGNTFQHAYRGIYAAGNSGTYSGNTFADLSQEGIYGYFGSNGTYANNWMSGLGNDGIHSKSNSSGNTIRGNVIVNCPRIPIEVQDAQINLVVDGNWVSCLQPAAASDSWMGLSIATGGGNHISITNNTIVSSRLKGAAAEIMGDNIALTGNMAWGFGAFILNGAQGSPVKTGGNKVYGGAYSLNDIPPAPGPLAAILSPETVYALGVIPMPQPPAFGGGGNAQPAPAPAPPASLPAGLAATQGPAGELAIALPAGTSSATLLIYPSSLTPAAGKTFAISGNVLVGGIPDGWRVTAAVTIAGTTYTLPAVQVAGGTVTAFAPVIVPVAPVPATLPVYVGHSRDGKTWIIDGVVQP
jgi:hypothetical protein